MPFIKHLECKRAFCLELESHTQFSYSHLIVHTPHSTMFGAQSSPSPFGTPSTTPAFGTPNFGTPSSTPGFSTPGFGTPSSTPAFGASSTPAFGGSSLFSSPFSSQQQQQPQQQQQQTSLFQQSPSTGFGFQNSLQAPQATPFPNSQLTTQMANVAPVPFSLADRDIQVFFLNYTPQIIFNFNFVLINLAFYLCFLTRQSLMLIRKILETRSMLLRFSFSHCVLHLEKIQF